MIDVINSGFVIEAEILHTLKKVFNGKVGVFGAMFGDELGVRGDKFAIGALGSNELYTFKFGKGALHSIWINLSKSGEITDGRKAFAGWDFSGYNIKFKLLNELYIDRAVVIKSKIKHDRLLY